MAKSSLKLILFFLCINICLYIIGFRVIHDSFMNRFFEVKEVNGETDFVNSNSDLQDSTPDSLEISSATETDNSWKVTDIYKTVLSFFLFLVNTAFMPLAFFSDTSLGLPWILRIILGGPLSIAYLMVIISWFKGQD